MDLQSLLPSFLFGLVGMGFFAYGRKLQKGLHVAAGLGLMVIPYFITGIVPMLIVCGVLTALPFAGKLL